MKLMRIFVALLFIITTMTVSAQVSKEELKARKELRKQSKTALHEKATKEARKEAKKLKKQGWQTTPGTLPIEKQIDKAFLMQMEYDEDLFPKYLMAEGMSIGENYDGAKMQAIELAKQNLAGQIQTEVTALIENNVANNQLEAGEAATATKSIMAAKSLISQSLGRVLPVVELYRVVDKKHNKNKEVLVRLAYDSKKAKEAAKKAVRAGLAEEGEALQNKLDNLLGW